MLSNLSNAMAIKLSSLQTLIINMPLELQASRSKLSIWTSVCSVHITALTDLSEQFSDGKTIVVSRSDLRRLAAQNDLTQYVLATVIWGYSSGMRGKRIEQILASSRSSQDHGQHRLAGHRQNHSNGSRATGWRLAGSLSGLRPVWPTQLRYRLCRTIRCHRLAISNRRNQR